MSFSKNAKLQVLQTPIDDASCAFAFLCGLFHGCGELTKNSQGLSAEIVTDIEELCTILTSMVKRLYGDNLEVSMDMDYVINKTPYFRIKFPEAIARRVLEDAGVLESEIYGGGINLEVDRNVVSGEEEKRAFVKGAFVACSTSSIKLSKLGSRSSTTGYHFEFSSHNPQFLEGIQELLGEVAIPSKMGMRKNLHILYLKDADAIKDLLAYVGATESVLDLSNEMATRGLRNTVNRQVNCINANISKTVEASIKQVDAINLINKKIGIESLPKDLQEVALLRLANPQESMEELIKLSSLKLTKSGLNHRFRRLIKIADILKG